MDAELRPQCLRCIAGSKLASVIVSPPSKSTIGHEYLQRQAPPSSRPRYVRTTIIIKTLVLALWACEPGTMTFPCALSHSPDSEQDRSTVGQNTMIPGAGPLRA